jgi:hypothetical protein
VAAPPDSNLPPPSEAEEENDHVRVPGFIQGGRVDRTGIALVHEGEYIVPAPGSEAILSPGGPGLNEPVINYYFPVVIEVVGSLSEEQIKRVADYVYDALEAELASRT